jgi:hypothetical protein
MGFTLLRAFAVLLLLGAALRGVAEPARVCQDAPPPSLWIVDSPYPFQAGAEATYDELYHGPWRVKIALTLYERPRGSRVAGTIRPGTIVEAVLGRTIVVHPLRFLVGQDIEVMRESAGPEFHKYTMKKGEPFWVLDSGNEGEFDVWWHCTVVSWDSTVPTSLPEDQRSLLGANQEEWVEIKDRRTGLTGWFKQMPQQGNQLVPALPTAKRTG